MPCRTRLAGAALLALCGGFFFFGSTAQAHQAGDGFIPGAEPSLVGCGKAQALIRALDGDGFPPATASTLEIMEETDVLHYKLDIEVSNLNTGSNTCTITGSNEMTIQSKSPALAEFTFRLRNQFNITGAFVNGTTPVTIATLSTSTRRATLDRVYAMDEVFTLTINYTGNTVSASFGSIEVRTHSGGTPVVSTLSEPYYAYTWWPTKDGDVFVPGDNSDKATLEFSITVPNNYVVPSNGTLQSVDSLSGNRNRYNWRTDYPITTYLVSFAATNYNTWTAFYNHPGGSMPVEFYIYPSNDFPSNRAGWEKSINMLEVFRPLFGEYPFINEKYGLYNFPFGGGMEHQTITGQSSFGESLTAHELGHQWWGDMITCKTWSDIWLNEGFATYSEVLWEEFKTGTPNPAAYFNAIVARKPSSVGDSVYVYPADTANVSRIFSSTYSYRKGAWVLHQLRHVVGDATFWNILADYRSAYEFKAADTDDFAAVASATFGQDLTWFFDQWVYQIGAPAYQTGWDTAKIDSQNYLMVRIRQTQTASYPHVFIMPVDLAITVDGSPQTVTVWNDQREQFFSVPVNGEVTALQFDPNQWILRTSAVSSNYVAGDLDGNLVVNLDDYDAFDACFTGADGALTAGCEPADFDGDGDIDCQDWKGFVNAWTLPDDPPELPQCAVGSVPTVSEWGIAAMALVMLSAATLLLRRTSAARGRA